jgi:Ca2+-binding EF-hand superfamily protein
VRTLPEEKRKRGIELKRIFEAFEGGPSGKADGLLDLSELGMLMKSLGSQLTQAELEQLIEELDVNGDGQVGGGSLRGKGRAWARSGRTGINAAENTMELGCGLQPHAAALALVQPAPSFLPSLFLIFQSPVQYIRPRLPLTSLALPSLILSSPDSPPSPLIPPHPPCAPPPHPQVSFVEFAQHMLEDDTEEPTEAVAEAIFDMMDTDGSGNLTMHEIKSAFETLNTGLTDEDVAEIVSRMDADDSGEVDREEFVKLITQILEGNL